MSPPSGREHRDSMSKVLASSLAHYIVSKFGYYSMLVLLIKNNEVGNTSTCGIYIIIYQIILNSQDFLG